MGINWNEFEYPKNTTVKPTDVYTKGELPRFESKYPDYEVVDFRPVKFELKEDFIPTGSFFGDIPIFNSFANCVPGGPRVVVRKKAPKVLRKYTVTVYDEPPRANEFATYIPQARDQKYGGIWWERGDYASNYSGSNKRCEVKEEEV